MTRERAIVLLIAALFIASALVVSADAWGKPKKDDHGFLGIKMQKLTAELREGLGIEAREGILVSEVLEDSPAAKAGIEDGDIIIKVDGEPVDSPSDVRRAIRRKAAGDEIVIEVQRSDRTKEYDVTLGEWPEDDSFAFRWPDNFSDDFPVIFASLNARRLGVRVEEMNEDLASYFGVKEGEGVLVLGVDEESAADEAGIKAGDVIVSVAGDEISSAVDIREAISELDEDDTAEIEVVRKNKTMTLKAEIPEGQRIWGDGMSFLRGHGRHHRPAPEVRVYSDDLREEMEDLRKQVEELRKELEDSKDG